MIIQAVPVDVTLPIRQSILRPHQTLADCHYPGDDEQTTRHFIAKKEDDIVGIISVYLVSNETLSPTSGAQFRAMATIESVRGQGYAQVLLNEAEQYASLSECTYIWCNARATAVGFYKKLGYETKGESFEVVGIGEHYMMTKRLR